MNVRGDFDNALIENFFDRSAYLFEEPANLLKQELSEPAVYNSIITAIAEGASHMNEISTKSYSIADSFFRFWYRFVPNNMTPIASGRMEKIYDKAVHAYLNDYMGLIFEKCVVTICSITQRSWISN